MSLLTKQAEDVFAGQNADGSARSVVNQDAQVWGAEIERILASFQAGGGIIFPDKATADASLAYAANQMAWVLGDATTANNGVYRKVGGSGSGSWVRLGDLPYSFIVAADFGAGTPNAIQATSALPVSTSALVLLNVFETNTTSPVTVSFNGGAPLTVKSNSGIDVTAGGLIAGMVVMGYISGSTFRLVNDEAIASLIYAARDEAQAAQVASETARDLAEDYRDQAAGYVNDIVSEKEVPIYSTVAGMGAVSVPAGLNAFRTNGFHATGDNGGALYHSPVAGPATATDQIGVSVGGSTFAFTRLHEDGAVDLAKHGLHLDGRDETAKFVDAFALALHRGLKKIRMPGGRSVRLTDATPP